MQGGILGKALNSGLHVIKTLHRRNGIALTLKALALTPDSTKVMHGLGCCSTGMESRSVAASLIMARNELRQTMISSIAKKTPISSAIAEKMESFST